ncbi:MAG: glycosyltransferase family 2 protein [Chloroflexi bacterium]|nr:glycosyltransferase family 2 protein [Chloroflexota bacterium]
MSVIIVNWNHGPFLKNCLEALSAQNYPDLDIMIADNGSTDSSPEWVAQNYPEVRLLRFPDNRGFARAFNQAVACTHSPFILSLNPDVTVKPDFLVELLDAISQDESIGMVAPKLLQTDNRSTLDSTGLFVDRRRRPYDRGQGETDLGQYDSQTDVFGACGGATLYRRAMLDDVGLAGEFFDEDFFAYYEDADLAWRAQGRGWRCVFAPLAVAMHRRGSGDTLRKRKDHTNIRGPRLALCNRYLMTLKNDSLLYFLIDFPLILAAELPRLAYTAFMLPGALKGLGDLVRKWSSAWSKRQQIRQRRTMSDASVRHWFMCRDK